MAKVVVSFDSYEQVDGFEGRQAMAQIRKMESVTSAQAYRASSSPRYVLEVVTDDDNVEAVQKMVETAAGPYRGFLSNWTVRVLKDMLL